MCTKIMIGFGNLHIMGKNTLSTVLGVWNCLLAVRNTSAILHADFNLPIR